MAITAWNSHVTNPVFRWYTQFQPKPPSHHQDRRSLIPTKSPSNPMKHRSKSPFMMGKTVYSHWNPHEIWLKSHKLPLNHHYMIIFAHENPMTSEQVSLCPLGAAMCTGCNLRSLAFSRSTPTQIKVSSISLNLARVETFKAKLWENHGKIIRGYKSWWYVF